MGGESGPTSASLTVSNEKGKSTKFTAEQLVKLPRLTIKAKDHAGIEAKYEGVTVAELLKAAEVTVGKQLEGALPATTCLVEAAGRLSGRLFAARNRCSAIGQRRAPGRPQGRQGAGRQDRGAISPGGAARQALFMRWVRQVTAISVRAVPGGETGPKKNQLQEPTVKVKVFNREGQLVGPVEAAKVVKSDAQWPPAAHAQQFVIARAEGHRGRAFCGTLLDNKRHWRLYSCVCCGLPLFASNSKFNSGTGWPSFFQPVAEENVATAVDRGHGMSRTEILCATVRLPPGPRVQGRAVPTGLRYCVNSESLVFTDEKELAKLAEAVGP